MYTWNRILKDYIGFSLIIDNKLCKNKLYSKCTLDTVDLFWHLNKIFFGIEYLVKKRINTAPVYIKNILC